MALPAKQKIRLLFKTQNTKELAKQVAEQFKRAKLVGVKLPKNKVRPMIYKQ